MAKRLTVFVAVFAALLSVTLSVQAEDLNYYWAGGSGSNYFTTANWRIGSESGSVATAGLGNTANSITVYIRNSNSVNISLDYSNLGAAVKTLNIGEIGGTTTATISRGGSFNIEPNKTINVFDNGTFNISQGFTIDANGKMTVDGGTVSDTGSGLVVNGTLDIKRGTFTFNNSGNQIHGNGTINVTGGTFNVAASNSLRIGNAANSTLNISGGEVTVSSPSYIGVSNYTGTINQSGGNVTFNGELDFGWGDGAVGEYNLTGGTMTTTANAGLWTGNPNGISTFTVDGGTANFNKSGESFTVGLGGTNQLKNVFTITSGTVNVTDTFAVKYTGILNIEGGTFNAPTITVDSASTFNMTGGSLKTNAINMSGGTFTQSGGTLVYNGKLSVTGEAVLNGAIDLSHFLAEYNQTVDVVETTAGVSGSYTVTGDDWTTAIVGNKITATYTGGNNNYYWTGNTNNVYFTSTNWNQGGTAYAGPTSDPGFLDDRSNPSFEKNCYILTTSSDVSLDYSTLGVASLTVGNGVGGTTGTAVVSRTGNIDVQTNLIVNKGGTVSASGAITVTSRNNTLGTLTVSGGTFNANSTTEVSGNLIVSDGVYNANGETNVNSGGSITINGGKFTYSSTSNFVNNGTMTLTGDGEFVVNSGSGTFRVGGANNNAEFKITGGKATFNTDVYIATSSNGTINQSGGETIFNSQLALGWGDYSGTYNLSGGTLNTNAAVGLWTGNSAGVSTFNVTGGTANFNKSGESFTIGLGGTNSLANDFNLKSGTVNAADTFAIKYNGILNVGQSGAGDGVLNANKIDINNGGNLNMSSGTINLGAGGITNSTGASPKDYTITLSGGTFGTNNASWATSLDATISSNAVTFAPEAGKSITWRGVMSGAGALTKTEAGTLELFGANSFEGGTTISNGQISLHANGSLGTGAIAIDANGSLTFTGDMTPQPKTIANAISGTGTIVKQGASNFTVNLDGNLTGFSGDMIISGGTLSVLMNGTNTALNVTNLSGSGNLELRLASGNGNTSLPNLTNNGFTGVISLVESGGANGNKLDTGYKSFDGFTFNINSGTTIYVDEAAFGANVNLSGTGNNEGHGALRLHKNMTGNITVMENNSVLGIDRTAVTVSGNITSGTDSGETTLVIKNVVDNNGSGTFTGVISDGNAGSKLGVQLSGGRHTFSGANTYTGMTTVSAGVLELTGDAVVANGPVTVANDGTLEYNVASGQKKKLSIDDTNKILSTGKVIKTGEGTLQLYSEAQGLIDISSLTVSSGQLDLKGYMTGGITVDAGGVFSPGNSVGEATFGGGYILYDGATLLIEQDATGIDKLNVGSFTFQESSISKNIELDITGIPFGSKYDIITSSTDFTGDLLTDEYWLKHFKDELPDYMTLAVVNNNTVRLYIDRNQVPEPSTWALLILGAAGMLYWRKRKNNK